MNPKIITEPIQFDLRGISGFVTDERYGEVGLQLMNEMWRVIHSANVATMGTNHWVYLGGGRMFVGVEVINANRATLPEQLEHLQFELHRYLRHVHIGPYQALPQKWRELIAEMESRGEVVTMPSLEVYGHHCDEASQLETTILIGLKA